MKTTKDNFIFKIVTEKAKEIFNSGLFELFALNNDDSETKIDTFEQLTDSLEKGLQIAIEVGYFQPNKSNETFYYLKNEYPNNIIIFNQDTNKIVCRMMHYDFKDEEEAVEQAEKIVELLNNSQT